MEKLLIFFLAAAGLLARDAATVVWEQAPEVFAGKVVQVQFSDGVRVRGQFVKAVAQTFEIAVEKTSNAQRVPKGLHTYERSQARRVWVGKRRVRGRILGLASGYLLVDAIALGLGEPLAGVYFFAALPIGYQIGKAFDYRMQEVSLIEDVSKTGK